MLQTQKFYCDYLDEVKSLLGQIPLTNNEPINLADLTNLRESIACAQLLVPVIGSFSSGKSALINSFLLKEYLPVNITPETSLATELYYSESEYLEAVRPDESFDRFQINEFEKVKDKASEYKYARAYINSDPIKSIQPLVLVDMPGYGSPLKQHNIAIIEYIKKGTHYIVLTSIEEGTLTRSMRGQISEVYNVHKGISFFLSKSNLRPESKSKKIAEEISSQLSDYFNEKHEVIPVGKNGGSDFKRIINTINPEYLIEKLFKDLVLNMYRSCKGEINTRIVTLTKTKNENQNTLEELQKGISDLVQKKNDSLKEVQEKYSDVSVGRIVEKIGKELSGAVEELADIAISQSSDAVSQRINDIVRQTLIREAHSVMDELSRQITSDFTTELHKVNNVLSQYSNGDITWLDQSIQSITTLTHSLGSGLTNWNDSLSKKDGNLYKVATTILGIATDFVLPVVELVIIFLPEILNTLMKNHREQKKFESVKNTILTQTIPEMKSKLRSQLPELFTEQVKNLIEEISKKFEVDIEKQKQIISSQQEEKKSNTLKIEEHMKTLQSILDELDNRTNELYN